MRTTLLIILLLFGETAFGQSGSECDLFTASIAYCHDNYQDALTTLLKFRNDFPKHPLIEEVYQEIGHLYLLVGDSSIAKQELKHVISRHTARADNNNFTPFSCKNWDTSRFCHTSIVYPETYAHLKHLACIDLVNIYKGENKIDSALKYLQLADTAYFYNTGCRNGNDMNAIEIALLYKDLYLKQGNIKAAIMELTSVIFAYEYGHKEVIQSLKELLPKIYTKEQLNNEIEQAITNLKKKTAEVGDEKFSWFQLNLFGVSLRIPMYMANQIKDNKGNKCETVEQMQEGLKNNSSIKELL